MGHGANAIVLGRVVRRTRDFVGHVQEVGTHLTVLLPLLPAMFPSLSLWLTYLVEVCLLNTLACDYAFAIGEMLAFGKER